MPKAVFKRSSKAAPNEVVDVAGPSLHCPIRGQLTAQTYAKDGLTFTEEKQRIDCIRFLLAKGYPKSHFKIETILLKFGHAGKNSFRTDIAVLDVPASQVGADLEKVRQHVRVIAEIKRTNDKAKTVKETQVYPAMDFLQDISALGIYWADIEQRLFYKTLEGTKTKVKETTIGVLPPWGQALGKAQLRSSDLQASANLKKLFERIEDVLHAKITEKDVRFEAMLQILLTKIHDEHVNVAATKVMTIQDFTDSPLTDAEIKKVFEKALSSAVKYYGKYLPKPVSTVITVPGSILRAISGLLGPIKILGSRRDVMQEFYMYFAQEVYKWDLAQYFTPPAVVDFIVSLVNPQAGDQVKDPACGSGDFLVSAMHHAQNGGGDISDAVFGADESPKAVQISVLNMVLNGDGKSNIAHEDSLAVVQRDESEFSTILCNPPFGVKIVERRFEILEKFELGREWKGPIGKLSPTSTVLDKQELGILFAELCVRQTAPGGRIGIILPNGYLANRTARYVALREWMLRQTRLVAVVAFPRFTFKKSGADVSASVVVLEKREVPLEHAADTEDYPFYAGILESVGWSVGDKGGEPIFRQDEVSGELILDAQNNQILDADFDRIIAEVRTSPVAPLYSWGVAGGSIQSKKPGWSVDIREVIDSSAFIIDAKRWCERASATRTAILSKPHFKIGDVADIIATEGAPKDKRALYQCVEIQNVADGVVNPEVRRGWQLPDRIKHGAVENDVFVAKIWSSIGKWFIAGSDSDSMVVSNGFHRLRMKPGKEDFLVDLIAGINTEPYCIQARSIATGSDGLADIGDTDLLEIVLPKLKDAKARKAVADLVAAMIAGRASMTRLATELIARGALPAPPVPARTSGFVQV